MRNDEFEYDQPHRSMRWYEWLLCLLLLMLAVGARAATVYRCDDGRGSTAFQDLPCNANQSPHVVDIAPAPTYAPSPQYAVASPAGAGGARLRSSGSDGVRRIGAPAQRSFECRSTDGQVFYRHSTCPHTIEAKDDHFGRGRGAQKKVEVHAVRVTRDEACAQMRRAGASGRSGHAHDEAVSSYEKNLGHDPCH